MYDIEILIEFNELATKIILKISKYSKASRY